MRDGVDEKAKQLAAAAQSNNATPTAQTIRRHSQVLRRDQSGQLNSPGRTLRYFSAWALMTIRHRGTETSKEPAFTNRRRRMNEYKHELGKPFWW
jgi:hypothetical protein